VNNIVTLSATAEMLAEPMEAVAAVRVAGEPVKQPIDKPPAETPEDPPLAEEQSADLAFDFIADPAEVKPGGVVAFHATMTNPGEATLEKVSVEIDLPAGATYVSESAIGFEYSEVDNRLTWTVDTVEAGGQAVGAFEAQIDGLQGDDVIVTATATSATLKEPMVVDAVVHLISQAGDSAWITPENGGWMRSADGRVELQFPAGAVKERTQVTMRPVSVLESDEASSFLFYRFELDAENEQKERIKHFDAPYELTAYFEESDLKEVRPWSPTLFWMDEELAEWTPIPCEVDEESGIMRARLDHFSQFAQGVEPSYGRQYLPSTDAFATEEWKGNSTVSHSLLLPPAPGNVGVNLNYNYSSESMNSLFGSNSNRYASSFVQQAGFLGWGWSLGGLGKVVQDRNTLAPHLMFAGGTYTMTNPSGSVWQEDPQSFLRIEHSGEGYAWYVWTPNGTKYTFGSSTEWGNGMAWGRDRYCDKILLEANLTEIEDTHGNKTKITYSTETRDCGCDPGETYVRGIRPTRIEYFPQDQSSLASVRVDFSYTSGRQDTHVDGWDTSAQVYYTEYRLTTTTAKVRNGTGADSFATARSYVTDHTFQGSVSTEAIMTLDYIRERGKDSGALPDWEFDYIKLDGNPRHWALESADNGQGGSVTYEYEEFTYQVQGNCAEFGNWTLAKTGEEKVIGRWIDWMAGRGKEQRTDSSLLDEHETRETLRATVANGGTDRVRP
jgi:uncharacterized repeat protein (TIGR01451 family)